MDYLLEATKKQMHKTIDDLQSNNLDEIKGALLKQLDVLEYVFGTLENDTKSDDTALIADDTPTYAEEETEENAPKEEPLEEDESQEDLKPTNALNDLAGVFEEEMKGYPFEKKLSGGYLKTGSIGNDIFVPETVIRDMGIEEGDVVRYDGEYFGRSRFTIIDKSNRKGNDIESFKYGIVKYDTSISSYYVEEDINGRSLRVDYVPQRYILSSKDESTYDISDSEVVDIAWYKNCFEKARVIWRHNTSEVESKKATISKKIIEYNKPDASPTKTDEAITPLLQGTLITLIGLEPYWAKYKKLVEERGGILITHSSKDHKISRTASIKKSDLVVVGISHTSHEASQHASEKCKVHRVPFTSMKGYGGATFIAEVYDKLNIKEKITY